MSESAKPGNSLMLHGLALVERPLERHKVRDPSALSDGNLGHHLPGTRR